MRLGSFAVHAVRPGRWLGLLAALQVMSWSGCAYVFGVYSNGIKTSLGYAQEMLNTLAFFKNLGASLGVVPGLIHAVAPPWVVLVSGAAMSLVGNLMIHLAIIGRTGPPARWLMCFYIAAAANSQSFCTTGALVSTVKNFPDDADRGLVLALPMGFAGLSGAILTQLHLALFPADDKGAALVLLMACIPTAVSLISSLVIRVIPRQPPGSQPATNAALSQLLITSVVLGAFLLVLTIVQLTAAEIHFPRAGRYVTAAMSIFILLASQVAIVINQEYKTYTQPPPPTAASTAVVKDDDATTTPELLVSSSVATGSRTSPSFFHLDVVRPPAARGQDHTILQALFTVDMLLLTVVTACGAGGMMTAIDNIGQIGQSLGYPQRSTSVSVSLISVCNYLGRVAVALGSDKVVARYRLPRPLALTATMVLSCVGHLLIAFGCDPRAASAIIGFCIGAYWTVLFAVVSEVFGLKNFATLYNLATLGSPLGSYILGVQLTGACTATRHKHNSHRRILLVAVFAASRCRS